MLVTTYLGTSSQIWYWSLHVIVCCVGGGTYACGSHRQHRTVKSSLCALAVFFEREREREKGGVHGPLVSICFYKHWYILIFYYKLTVSNGFSLMVWKCVAVTFSSSSFKWGGPSAFGIHMFLYELVFCYIFL